MSYLLLNRLITKYSTCLSLTLLLGSFTAAAVAPLTTQNDSAIYYCIDPDWLPFEAIKNGKHIGISADYLAEIARIGGLRFKLVVTVSWEQSLNYAREGRCRFLPMLNKTREREIYLDFSSSYFQSPEVFLTRKDIMFISGIEGLRGLKVAMVPGYWYVDRLSQPELGIEPIFANSVDQAILMVSLGDADVVSTSLMTAVNTINQHNLTNLHIAGGSGFSNELRMGVAKNDSELLSQLESIIAQIPQQTHQKIFTDWGSVSLKKEFDYTLLYWFTALASILGTAILARAWTLRKHNELLSVNNRRLTLLQTELEEKNQILEQLANTDPLTNAYNRRYLTQVLKKELKRCERHHTKLCVIVLDIDHFKKINDKYGHDKGDEVLQDLVSSLQKALRDQDTLARWGGEEFLILCPETSQAQAQTLLTRVIGNIKQKQMVKINYTLSGGLAEFRNGESQYELIRRADLALYSAKSAGRDRIEVAC